MGDPHDTGGFDPLHENVQNYFSGWERASVTLTYGANALLPADSRGEFARRLEQFSGLVQPEPLES